jgi:hypothetical protein
MGQAAGIEHRLPWSPDVMPASNYRAPENYVEAQTSDAALAENENFFWKVIWLASKDVGPLGRKSQRVEGELFPLFPLTFIKKKKYLAKIYFF